MWTKCNQSPCVLNSTDVSRGFDFDLTLSITLATFALSFVLPKSWISQVWSRGSTKRVSLPLDKVRKTFHCFGALFRLILLFAFQCFSLLRNVILIFLLFSFIIIIIYYFSLSFIHLDTCSLLCQIWEWENVPWLFPFMAWLRYALTHVLNK